MMKKQCYDQVEELCSRYGRIDIMWYDGSWLAHKGSDTTSAWFWEPIELNKIVRKYNPKTLLNPRSGYEGDFYCDEGSHEISGKIIPVPWEKNMCVCSGSSWGWMAEDPVSDFDWLIRMLVNVICRGGNLLLNVGPDRNGKLSSEVTGRMREIGAWLKEYGDAVYGTRGGPIEPADGIYGTTCKGNLIYLHILDRDGFSGLSLPDPGYRLVSCETYHGRTLEFDQAESGIRITLPKDLKEEPVTILRLKLDKEVDRADQADIYFTGKE